MSRSMSVVSPLLPNAFFIAIAGLAGIAALTLPETLNCELPDMINEVGVNAPQPAARRRSAAASDLHTPS